MAIRRYCGLDRVAVWRTMSVFINPRVKLESVNPFTGAAYPVPFWTHGDRIFVHPDRWDDFKEICETEPESWQEIQ